jgi:hypothetical protein
MTFEKKDPRLTMEPAPFKVGGHPLPYLSTFRKYSHFTKAVRRDCLRHSRLQLSSSPKQPKVKLSSRFSCSAKNPVFHGAGSFVDRQTTKGKKKGVRFASDPVTSVTLRYYDLSPEDNDLSKCWYNDKEYFTFARERSSTAAAIKLKMRSNDNYDSKSKQLDLPCDITGLGLEHLVIPRSQRRAKELRARRHVKGHVLRSQRRQNQQSEQLQEEMLASQQLDMSLQAASEIYSRRTSKRAHFLRGVLDHALLIGGLCVFFDLVLAMSS